MKLLPISMDDLPLYEAIHCDPAMMAHVGGPFPRERIPQVLRNALGSVERGEAWVFRVIPDEDDGVAVGNVCLWESDYRGEPINEIGWTILPPFQGRGLARRAVDAILEMARAAGRFEVIHAYPATDNGSSNGICRKMGFSLIEECDLDYAGRALRCNHWHISLRDVSLRFLTDRPAAPRRAHTRRVVPPDPWRHPRAPKPLSPGRVCDPPWTLALCGRAAATVVGAWGRSSRRRSADAGASPRLHAGAAARRVAGRARRLAPGQGAGAGAGQRAAGGPRFLLAVAGTRPRRRHRRRDPSCSRVPAVPAGAGWARPRPAALLGWAWQRWAVAVGHRARTAGCGLGAPPCGHPIATETVPGWPARPGAGGAARWSLGTRWRGDSQERWGATACRALWAGTGGAWAEQAAWLGGRRHTRRALETAKVQGRSQTAPAPGTLSPPRQVVAAG